MSNQIKYTVGFLFGSDKKQVALIRKVRPEWQNGKLNGIGGHVEAGETPEECMIREFWEEAWIYEKYIKWTEFACLNGKDFRVYCFYAIVESLDSIKSKTDEKVEVINLKDIHMFNLELLDNLCWLIPLAGDSMADNRPIYSTIEY